MTRYGLISYSHSTVPVLPALVHLPGTENALAEAAEKAGKYEWRKAAETYRQVVDWIDRTKDPKLAADISELLAASYFKAAFQCVTRDEFKPGMILCQRAEEESAVLYKAAGLDAFAKRARARALFTGFWIQEEADDKRAALAKCIPLAEESAQIFEVHGDRSSVVETLRDLVVYREKAVQSSVERRYLVDHFEKAVETTWRIIEEFQGTVTDQIELETLNVLTRLYMYAENIVEQPRYDELERKLAKVKPRITELSHKIGTPAAQALASEATGILATDLEGNIVKSVELFEQGVSQAKEAGDRYVLGRLSTSISASIRYLALSEEFVEKRREQLDKAMESASNGIRYLQPLSPGLWLKYAHKRWMDASTWLAYAVETDIEKKRAMLRNAIDEGEKALVNDKPSFVPGIGHEVSRAIYFLASMDTGPEEKSRLLIEALPMREEMVRTVTLLSPQSWNRGVMLNYLALLRAELSKAESDGTRRLQLLKQASSDMEQCIQICSTLAGMRELPGKVRVYAQYNEGHGDILQELYEATEDVAFSRQAVAAYREAISYLSNSALIGPIPGIRWKVAQTYDSLREFNESSESFRQAAHEYRALAKKIEPLASVFEEFAKYMEAWAVIEEARGNHEREQYNAAAESYTKVSELLRSMKPWSYLSSHYSACSFLELGEAMTRQERQNAAIDSFTAAQRTFHNAIAELESRVPTAPLKDRRELNSWVEIVKGRYKYSSGRLLLEEAKVLDSRMEEEASSAKYKAASDSFRTLLNQTSHKSTRTELEALSLICEAWAKMKSAEISASPELYAEAAKSFVLAETKARGKKTKLSALANASMCRALEYGSLFRRTRDSQLYGGVKKNLEAAADFYEEAGIKKAADWTRATQRFFDALRYLRDAEIETDPKKRPELFRLAENHLQLASTIYGDAGYAKKKQETLRYLERTREERQLLLMPVEVLEESPAVSEVTISPVTFLEDKAPGLEKLRDAHIRGSVSVSSTELNAGEALTLDLRIVNVGKETATLARIEDVAPGGLDFVKEKTPYSIEDRSINLRGKRLDNLKSYEVKIVLRSRRKGSFDLRPRITYFDDKGTNAAYEFEPKTVVVREIGVLGWIRGPH